MIKEPLTKEDVNKAAEEYAWRGDMYDLQTAFKVAAQWRINSVWHDCDDRTAALENGKIVEYEDNWEEYYSLVLKWAYKKDLLPNNKD